MAEQKAHDEEWFVRQASIDALSGLDAPRLAPFTPHILAALDDAYTAVRRA